MGHEQSHLNEIFLHVLQDSVVHAVYIMTRIETVLSRLVRKARERVFHFEGTRCFEVLIVFYEITMSNTTCVRNVFTYHSYFRYNERL